MTKNRRNSVRAFLRNGKNRLLSGPYPERRRILRCIFLFSTSSTSVLIGLSSASLETKPSPNRSRNHHLCKEIIPYFQVFPDSENIVSGAIFLWLPVNPKTRNPSYNSHVTDSFSAIRFYKGVKVVRHLLVVTHLHEPIANAIHNG